MKKDHDYSFFFFFWENYIDINWIMPFFIFGHLGFLGTLRDWVIARYGNLLEWEIIGKQQNIYIYLKKLNLN